MIQSIKICEDFDSNEIAKYHYLKEGNCKDNLLGKEFSFTKGINVIIGKNGCGKSTLLNLMKELTFCRESYLTTTYFGAFNHLHLESEYLSTFSIATMKADYALKSFNLNTTEIKNEENDLETKDDVANFFAFNEQSSGEYVKYCVRKMFNTMFNGEPHQFDYHFDSNLQDFKSVMEYYDANQISIGSNIWTMFMDEPDKGLDVENLKDCLTPLFHKREDTQVIAVIHNPLILYKLSQDKDVNFIELTPNYLDTVVKSVKEYLC